MGERFLTYSTAMILQAVANGYLYGFDIVDVTGVPGGTVYPALRGLEEAGSLDLKWEKQSIAQKEQRPPRKYYELTREGVEELAEALQRYRLLEQTELHTERDPKPSEPEVEACRSLSIKRLWPAASPVDPLVGVIVPRRLRSDWRQEWEAELRSREALLAHGSGSTPATSLTCCGGAPAHSRMRSGYSRKDGRTKYFRTCVMASECYSNKPASRMLRS